MWAEARKQEKRLRGLMVDHKRRAERRRDFYEKTKLDPNQFLQIHGQSAKLHFDQTCHSSGPSNGVMMPWQGQKDNLIDRFDGRAHLDIIPEINSAQSRDEENTKESRLINYERYRILIQNDFLKIPEEKFLQTISYEEKYGTTIATKAKEDKKKSERFKSAIGYVYEDTETCISTPSNETEKYSDDSDLDLDLTVDVHALDTEARSSLNKLGKNYSLSRDEFVKLLLQDIEEARVANLEKQREEDKALFSQKKTRRERRLLKSKSLVYPRPSTPSYSTAKDKKDRSVESGDSSSGRSRSNSPENAGKIEFITSFGNDSEDERESTNLAKQSNFSNKKNVRSQMLNCEMIGPKLPQNNSSRYKRGDRFKPSSPNRNSSSFRYDKRRRRDSKSDSSSSSSSDDNSHGPRYRSKYRSRRNSSSSPENIKEDKPISKPMSPPIKRYYKPTLAKESSDELDLSDGDLKDNESEKLNTSTNNGNSKGKSDTVKAKIQRKLQAQLKKQFKADKKAENERKQRLREEQNCRDEELKEVFSKYRKRERYSRYKNCSDSSDGETDRRYYSRRSRGEDRRRSRSSDRRRSRNRRDRHGSDADDHDDNDGKKPKLVDY